MIKQLLGIAVLVTLSIIVIFSFVDDNTKESSGSGTTESNAEGAGIKAPGQTGIKPGKMAPDFELQTLSGDTFKLSDLRGKKVILNFWASWCNPCKKEMPEMQKFYEEHKDEVEVVAVNLTGNEVGVDAAKEYIKKHNYTYPVPLDKKMDASEKYGVTIIPTTYFIGTDGKIQQPHKSGPMTYEYMTKMLDKLK
ncbi:Peroxiredoxin [Virgibacillus subterraneus]|uniref:Peroxiredoxin n=2 Tax=Virgibacillus TaxID=84406 RepID=A0A1H1C2E3_9BACI|nr:MULTISPECIES: redoxin domain-containing protein [Virgibacillus]SDQ58180.1 Peroxiredoxin [Virgibacillus salinus]SEQ55173.1 Peroxiredoxin [Virgibacillus subterraneus]